MDRIRKVEVILFLIEYLVLVAFVVLAILGWGAIACKRTGLPSRYLFMLGFAALALGSYLVFFVFLLDAFTGRTVMCLLGVGSLAMTALQLKSADARKVIFQTDVGLPILLLVFYAASCQLVLFLHGGDTNGGLRPRMPPDNFLPELLADRLWEGGTVHEFMGMTLLRVDQLGPFFGDWLSSDRPPLQAALYLFCHPFVFFHYKTDDIYRVTSTLFQATWLPAVYLLARELRISRYALGLMLVWFAGSGFLLFHSIYAWPKLLAASLFLAGLSILLFCGSALPRKNTGALIALGLVWGLALLAHGGILFSFLAVPFLPAAWRLLKAQPRGVLAALAVFIAVGLPWTAYQKFYDPPGNRLIKWHFAGVIPLDSRGTMETLRDSYTQLSLAQWAENRWGNVESSLVWGKIPSAGASVQSWQSYLNEEGFRRVTAVLGLLCLGFVVLAMKWVRKKQRGGSSDSVWPALLRMNVACYLIWIVLMFSPGSAIVHQGSYAMLILFMMIGALGMAELPNWAGLSLLVCQWMFFVFAWLFYFPGPITMDAVWFAGLILYGSLMALFAASLWRFLPPALDDKPMQSLTSP